MNSPTKRLLVRNIYPGTQSDTLRKVFGKYGEITSVHIPQGVNNRGQSYAFVEFQTVREAETAFDVLNNTSLDGSVIHCQFVDARELHQPRRRDVNPPSITPSPPPSSYIRTTPSTNRELPPAVLPSLPQPGLIVPQPAPLLAAAPINPMMEVSRYNTSAGGEFTIDTTGRLTRRSQLEEEQRTGQPRPPASQNPLLVQSAITIASAEKPLDDGKDGMDTRAGVMTYVKTHPQLVIDYDDI